MLIKESPYPNQFCKGRILKVYFFNFFGFTINNFVGSPELINANRLHITYSYDCDASYDEKDNNTFSRIDAEIAFYLDSTLVASYRYILKDKIDLESFLNTFVFRKEIEKHKF